MNVPELEALDRRDAGNRRCGSSHGGFDSSVCKG